jgi:ferric iron reductase protein FhuF
MSRLFPQQKHRLEQEFRLLMQQTPTKTDALLSFPVASFEQKQQVDTFLRQFGAQIGTEELSVAASMFSKRYSSLLLAGGLYAMSRLGHGLALQTDKVMIHAGPGWEMSLQLSSDETLPAPSSGSRTDWREKVVRQMLHQNLLQVFQQLSCYLPTNILWENAASYVYFYYEKWMDEAELPEEKQLLAEDFRFLMDKKNRTVSGFTPNPLAVRFRHVPHPTLPDKELRLRRTCCLYHRLPGGANCITCPSLADEERQERCAQLGKQ